MLSFYRIAGCIFCNLRLREILKKIDDFGKKFFTLVFFHSPTSDFLIKVVNPFNILKNFKVFEKYEVERSMGKVFWLYSNHKKYFLQ
ncbi:MAG: hypothetical protein CM15mP117_03760 [Alphaproteobacteria bacterium]|nr:MAG: hypothetical protein CM15mP117_03760 [Alphaproteobacteria bacterium]